MGALLSCIHQITDKPILFIASKMYHPWHLLLESGLFDIRVIHLMRDRRAVANSYIQRYIIFVGGVRLWVVTGTLAFWFRSQVSLDNWLQLKCEELATQPENTLKAICSFLEADFQLAMLRYRTNPYFDICGSLLILPKNVERISFDERWRKNCS